MDYHDDLTFRRKPSGLCKPPPPRPRPKTSGGPSSTLPSPFLPAGSSSISTLRPARSATNLRVEAAHAAQLIPPLPDCSQLPVGFVVDDSISPDTPSSPLPSPDIRRAKSSSAVPSATPKEQSKWKAALGEAQYFAGGLISRPAESSRHHTVIRHSHALVWYRGHSSSVSISILSDAPLPDDRSVWLQQKGYSGSVGMSLKALVGTTSNWIDVTPATQARADQMPQNEERAYQRDLRRFAKKATGRAKKHVPRETLVVRIPAAAMDGYFRLVVCTGGKEGGESKKSQKRVVLCGCPVFRIASTSLDAAVIRGASLKTMPIEVGVKVGSFVGRQYANKYVGVARAVASSKAGKAVPHLKKASTMGRAAYEGYRGTQLSDRVNESWERGKPGRYDSVTGMMEGMGGMIEEGMEGMEGMRPLRVIGHDAGPEPPFPVKFDGRVGRGSGSSMAEYGFPTANMRDVTDTVKMRMPGVFAAWVMILPGAQLPDICDEWYEAVVSVAPPRDNHSPEVVPKNKVRVHIIRDFDDGTSFFDARLKVILMGFLHPPLARETALGPFLEKHMDDTTLTLASLSRENWLPHGTLARMKTLDGERSLDQRLEAITGKVQRGVDRIPLHFAGIRSESSMLRDQIYGNGGIWIAR